MSALKGGQFEREICVLLSKWYSKSVLKKERDDIFWRTAGSGARATQRRKREKATCNSYGDICYIDDSGKKLLDNCIIELKRGYTVKPKVNKSGKVVKGQGLSLTELLDGMIRDKKRSNPLLIKWMEKISLESKQAKIDHPIIIFKRDRKAKCIVLKMETFKLLEKNQRRWLYPNDGPSSIFHIDRYNFIVLRLEDFLYWCDPKAFWMKVERKHEANKSRYEIGKYGVNVMKEILGKKKKIGLKLRRRK